MIFEIYRLFDKQLHSNIEYSFFPNIYLTIIIPKIFEIKSQDFESKLFCFSMDLINSIHSQCLRSLDNNNEQTNIVLFLCRRHRLLNTKEVWLNPPEKRTIWSSILDLGTKYLYNPSRLMSLIKICHLPRDTGIKLVAYSEFFLSGSRKFYNLLTILPLPLED